MNRRPMGMVYGFVFWSLVRLSSQRQGRNIEPETNRLATLLTGFYLSKEAEGCSKNTVRAYCCAIDQSRDFVQKPFAEVTLADLQQFDDSLSGLAPASRTRTLSAVKSLLSFCANQGVLSMSPGAGSRLPQVRNVLPERILSESQVLRLLDTATNPKDHVILRLLYIGGLRVSQLWGLTWGSFREQDGGEVQPVVHGKGARPVLLACPPAYRPKSKPCENLRMTANRCSRLFEVVP